MVALIIVIFILGYTAVAFEHKLRLDKASTVLIMAGACWTIYALGSADKSLVEKQLLHQMSEIAGIIFFILGAMTIVELIDSHEGFEIITKNITTVRKRKLLWLLGSITFLMSALLDNLTTAIVMMSMVMKIIPDKIDRWRFGGIIIICANAGGAFSPLGDVTTTMLWVGNQISAFNIIKKLVLPSMIVALVPMLIMHFKFGKTCIEKVTKTTSNKIPVYEQRIIFYSGLALLVFVPVFKSITHLPPFMGMLFALGLIWLIAALVHKGKDDEMKEQLSVANALQKIDTPSILFFLGILLTVGALQAVGVLGNLANWLSANLKSDVNITASLGVLSSVVDNVPLVAAAQGMYTLEQYPTDHNFWELLALTTGTGGSMIIIGSAAGVAVMGIESIPFGWYFKNISWLAALGFVAGIICFALIN